MAILGAGRAGRSLATSARAAGVDVALLWSRHQPTEADPTLRVEVIGGWPPPAPPVDLIVLAVSDAAVGELAGRLAETAWLADARVLAHLSGALPVTALAPASRADLALGSLHPLRALVGAATSWRGALCALGGDPQAKVVLRDLALALGAVPVELEDDGRALYHAGATLAGNDVVALIHAAITAFVAAGIPREQAQQGLLQLCRGALDNVERLGAQAGLTGPLVRGDDVVLQAHLTALTEADPAAAELHRAATRYLLRMAGERIPSTEKREAIERLLRS